MALLNIYYLFAFTTALTAVYELLYPVMRQRKIEHGVVNDKAVIYITFFVISLLIAPVMLLSCIVPSMSETFRNVLARELFKE